MRSLRTFTLSTRSMPLQQSPSPNNAPLGVVRRVLGQLPGLRPAATPAARGGGGKNRARRKGFKELRSELAGLKSLTESMSTGGLNDLNIPAGDGGARYLFLRSSAAPKRALVYFVPPAGGRMIVPAAFDQYLVSSTRTRNPAAPWQMMPQSAPPTQGS